MVAELLSGGIPALIVYLATRRGDKADKLKLAESRDVAKDEFTAQIKPALDNFQISLLDKMNGTYLRSAEARIHFGNIQDTLERLEEKVAKR